jgi:hypothetical protein
MFSDSVLQYYQQLVPPPNLPQEVEVMNPYLSPAAWSLTQKFYTKYYQDQQKRTVLFGINPGRFGGGITGIPFTDPIQLSESCGIENRLEKRAELSSRFIYEMIHAYGSPRSFYQKYFISAVSPLGYLKDGINLNYYDIKGYKQLFEAYVCQQIEAQLDFGIDRQIAYSIGKGKNIAFLQYLNQKYQYFEKILPLPHPRWVMQYRLKRKEEFIREYIETLA